MKHLTTAGTAGRGTPANDKARSTPHAEGLRDNVNKQADSNQFNLVLTTTTAEARVDSRTLAQHLHIKHQHLFEQIKDYRSDFEQLGKVRFETEASPDSRTGQKVKFAMLNEDQSLLMLTYSRNSVRVRELKVRLVRAFGQARRAADMRQTEYLPEYHRLHDAIRVLAGGSVNQRFVHMNVNRALNQFAGVAAGQRRHAAIPQQALLIIGQMMAARAMQGSTDYRVGYQRIKQQLLALTAAAMLPGGTPC